MDRPTALAFAAVSFRYRTGLLRRPGRDVLTDFSWTLPAGRTVLLGPNGAGKTTLLSLAAQLLRPSTGTVRINGATSARTMRAAVALMPQNVAAIPGFTAAEQVAYAAWLRGGPRRTSRADAATALALVGLSDERDSLVSHLSGGQQRRIGLAQILARPARILLLDEPTAGLDPAQRARFRAILADLPRDVPALVSTHQVDDLGDVFDTVAVLDAGRIVFEGPPAAFLSLAPAGSARPAEDAFAALIGTEV